MMKIFRRIRKKLLETGKLKQYFFYACGEIFFIVLGILIAWKINDLNEVRKNKIVQEKIYESLDKELKNNLTSLDTAIKHYENNKKDLLKTLNYIGVFKQEIPKEVKEQIIEVKFRSTSLRKEALTSINATDKFQFLKEDTLTDLLVQYPTLLKSYENQEAKIKNIVNNRLKPVIENYVSLIDMLPNSSAYLHAKENGKSSDYLGLLNDKSYQNSIVDELLQTKIQLKIAKSLQAKTITLADQLTQELEK